MHGSSQTSSMVEHGSNEDEFRNGGVWPASNGFKAGCAEVPQQQQNLPPLVTAFKELAEVNAASFQFPGHNRGAAAPSSLLHLIGQSPFLHDIEVFDNTSSEGPLAEAQKIAAEVFGSSETRFLVGGTTCGIHAAIMGTCNPGDTLIVPRNCHISVISAMVLSGAVPKYLFPDYDSNWDIATAVSPSEVEKAIRELEMEGRKPAAVLITSPTYHGICSNLKDISVLCHVQDIPLIVDEAHGAHFGFHPELPVPALQQGADVVLQSTHKVLLSFTQSSMMHIQGDLVDREKINRSLRTLQSTSPNSLLFVSLDASTAQLRDNPAAVLQDAVHFAIKVKHEIKQIPGISVLEYPVIDPLRVTVGLHDLGITGYEADSFLYKDQNIVCGLTGSRFITFIFTPGTSRDHVDRLILGLKHLSSSLFVHPKKKQEEIVKPADSCQLFTDVKVQMTPREAFFAKKTKVEIKDAIGRIGGELICPYPPGIPVVIPGELVSEKALDVLLQAKADGAKVIGASDPLLSSMLVCDV